MRKIELLSPAKTGDIGIEAIRHGADAVYIGAPKFGARNSANCSVEEIEQLCNYAHRYYGKVYVTLNTLLRDEELEEAQKIVYQLYNVGVDALIVQDMALLEMSLPPIALHASTQCNNRTLEKVLFLEKCGFEQVVLARELSLNEIKHIADNSNVALESFVHGALCVSYSGQCYMSEEYCSRSANRGMCAQMCRLPYSLYDTDGKVLERGRHLLSLKDFDASRHLSALIDAGVSSFKIEGRLKDVDYVKTVTSFYRQQLDTILEGKPHINSLASGSVQHFFMPDPERSFSRGATDYFLERRNSNMASMLTPKSIGKCLGKVKGCSQNGIRVVSELAIHNGDGLCAITPNNEIVGFRVNRVENGWCYPFKMPQQHIPIGSVVYRNFDMWYNKTLSEGDATAKRTIAVQILLQEHDNEIYLQATDEDGIVAELTIPTIGVELTRNAERQKQLWETQLAKLGETIFVANKIELVFTQHFFIPASLVTNYRRELISRLIIAREQNRIALLKSKKYIIEPTSHKYIEERLDYRANVNNHLAEAFYKRHQAEVCQYAFEKEHVADAELMRTRYCLRYELKLCPKLNPHQKATPLVIEHGKKRWRLMFDCAHCEMVVKSM